MANLLIGSSNVNRHYRTNDFSSYRKYEMVKCTQMSGFKVYMDGVAQTKKMVVISVVENFVVNAVGADVTSPEPLIDECIKDFLSSVVKTATRLPDTKFGIVMPLQRPALAWYQDRVASITEFIEEGIRAMISDKNCNNVMKIECISSASQQFETDLIHLTKTSAKVFLDLILDQAETFGNAPVVDLTEQGEIRDSDDNSYIAKLEERLDRIERNLRMQSDKNVANDLMFARVREEADSTSNKAKEDRIVINSLTSAAPLPADPKLKISALREIVAEVFKTIIPDFKGKVVYLTQGKHLTTFLPMVEVKLDKTEFAIEMRKAFADKKKNNQLGPSQGTLFMSNSVNLATRIRVDIMKAIAKKLSNRDEIAYVAGFTSRPTLHIRRNGTKDTKPLKSYSFIDSVSRYGGMLVREDLETAYGRAGRSFNGQLKQNFVVLNEIDQEALQSVAPNEDISNRQGTSGYRGNRGGGSYGGARGARGGGTGGGKGTKRAGDSMESSKQKK